VDIEFDAERSSKKYKEYFIRERNKRLDRKNLLVLIFMGLVFIALDMMFDADVLLFIGVFSLAIALSIFLYYYIKFGRASKQMSQYLDLMDVESERKFKYKFDEEKVAYESQNTYRETKWNLIKEFEDHGDDFYIFYERHILQDIISRELLGDENFELFKEIALNQVSKNNSV